MDYGTYGQSQGSPSQRVDEEQSRDCKDDLNSTVAKRGIQGFNSGGLSTAVRVRKNGRAVEGDDCALLAL